jgi:hypothetical protein
MYHSSFQLSVLDSGTGPEDVFACRQIILIYAKANHTHLTFKQIKAVPLHTMQALGGRGDRSYTFTTSALDGVEWSASRPGRALPPEKDPPVSIGQEAGWAPDPVWTQRLEEKSFASAGNRTPIARSSSL